MEILQFIAHLEMIIKKPRGRRSNFAVNCAAEFCIVLIENFLDIKFPKTIGSNNNEMSTNESYMVGFILKSLEKDITNSMVHTALKHAVRWRKKLTSKGDFDT
ncbi:hypothetical protein [Shinella zoogloeoides]|uniref:Uncharacterized protein n=2 Tax=Shinella zoogloeoides TaxID=352475 RepID=A0A6N8TPG8_SHIZO|nr:hypothetical protein [Shinella zoogloeoides]MXO03138.1 hypothetical protein [Shinella zoogloeoides]UEX81869.1 hypothetical protein K8M09_00750 [Shinella zoogloeoides]